MPGISLIGDSRNAERNRPTSLPAEARSLSRMLRLLKSPETAATALIQSLATLPCHSDPGSAVALVRVRQRVVQSIQQMREAGWDTLADRYAEYNMALAVESVLQDPSSFVVSRGTGAGGAPNTKKARADLYDNNNIPLAVAFTENAQADDDNSSTDMSSVIATSKKNGHNDANNRANTMSLSPLSKDDSKTNNKRQGPRSSSQSAVARRLLPLVSDSSTLEASETCQDEAKAAVEKSENNTETAEEEEESELGVTNAARNLWSIILESFHLQVAARTTSVWGRKKIYEVYNLARPMQDIADAYSLPALRQRLETECRTIFDGVRSDAANHCRVYVTLQPHVVESGNGGNGNGNHPTQALHVQINLDKLMDLQDERNRSVSGEKKKKAEREFVALLVPGSNLFALTASRSPSRSRFTTYILTVLENILTETTNHYAKANSSSTSTFSKAQKVELNDLAVKRFGDLSGTEPLDLLRAARAATEGEAVGRYALMAEKDQSNPVADLHAASTTNLLGPSANNKLEIARVAVGRAHPGNLEVATMAAKIATYSNGTVALVAANHSGTNLWVDHTVKQQQSRKRARGEALGGAQDCPSLQRMCWKWAGKTTAASACWLDSDNTNSKSSGNTPIEKLPTTDFKCAVVMKGENVIQGLQALMDAGLMEGPLPDFLRDAPSLGSTTIRVNHGSFAAADTRFEEV